MAPFFPRSRDSAFLEVVVGRLERELRWYQKELDVSDDAARDVKAMAAASQDGPAPWSVDPELFPPLLASYDRRIEELEGVASRVTDLQEAARVLGEENSRLRADVAASMADLRAAAGASRGAGGGDRDHAGDAEEVALLRQEVAALRSADASRRRETARITEALQKRTSTLEAVRASAQDMSGALEAARRRLGALTEESRRSGQAAAAALNRAEGLSERLKEAEEEAAAAREAARESSARAASLERTVASLSTEAAREGEAAVEQAESFRVSVCIRFVPPCIAVPPASALRLHCVGCWGAAAAASGCA